MANVEEAVRKLKKAGLKDIDSMPIPAITALASLSSEEINVLATAQKKIKWPRDRDHFGIIIF